MVINRTRPLDLPPDVAEAFVADMHEFLAAQRAARRDEIAARQLRVLREHIGGNLRLIDVKAMFHQMRQHLDREQ